MKRMMLVGFAWSLLCVACGSSAKDAVTSSKINVSPDPEVGEPPDAGINADTGAQRQNATRLVAEQRNVTAGSPNFAPPLCNSTYAIQNVDIASRTIVSSHCTSGLAESVATVTFSEVERQTLLTALQSLEVVVDGSCTPENSLETLTVHTESGVTTYHDSAGVCNRAETGFTYAKNVDDISAAVRGLVKMNWSSALVNRP